LLNFFGETIFIQRCARGFYMDELHFR